MTSQGKKNGQSGQTPRNANPVIIIDADGDTVMQGTDEYVKALERARTMLEQEIASRNSSQTIPADDKWVYLRWLMNDEAAQKFPADMPLRDKVNRVVARRNQMLRIRCVLMQGQDTFRANGDLAAAEEMGGRIKEIARYVKKLVKKEDDLIELGRSQRKK